jgi:serine protease Do
MVLALAPARAAEMPLDRAMAAVLTVHTADDADRFLGSAFLWGEQAEVAVTNAHVVQDATEVRLTDANGKQEIATVIARDPLRDVAVIAVEPGRRGLIPSLALPRLGAEVWALGAPLGIEFSVTEGTISARARQVDAAAPIRMIQHDAAVNPGSSGGPLVDAEGGLVGMNSQIADGSRMFVGIAYAIPAPELSEIVAGLIEETLPPLPKLGLRARAVDRQVAEALGVAPTGLLVDETEAGALAEAAGVMPGDILLAVNGTVLNEPGDLAFAIEAAQAEGHADLALMRGGAMLLLPLDLAVEDQSALALRDIDGAVPKRVQDYTLATLGLTIASDGRITGVTDNSPALFAGLAVGDMILRVDGALPETGGLGAMVVTGPVLFLLQGEGGTRHVLLDPFGTADARRPIGGANVLDPAVVVF